MPDYYLWISSGGCEVCTQLDGIHSTPPQRPHPHCGCSVVKVDPHATPGLCVLREPLLLGEGRDGGGDLTLGPPLASTRRVIFEILCRDMSVVEVEVADESEDPELPFTNSGDVDSFFDSLMPELEAKALALAELACPACTDAYEDI